MILSPGSIFISYRRSDSIDVTGRVYDRLIGCYGKESIFKDVYSIPYGSDFRDRIHHCINQCEVLIAIIGPTWLESKDQNGARRIDDPRDWVRTEIEIGLERNITVIPLLVGNARLPNASELPKSMKKIAYRNFAQARPDPDFHKDIDRLLQNLDPLFGNSQSEIAAQSSPHHSRLFPIKSKAIEERISILLEDYKALSIQQSYIENAVSKNNLKRQQALLEEEIEKLETELRGL